MADKIKQIQIGAVTYDIKDAAAVSSINGYSNADINAGTATFANSAITETELKGLLGITVQANSNSGN